MRRAVVAAAMVLIAVAVPAGAPATSIPGPSGRRLGPGRYRLVAIAQDSAGAGVTATVGFRIAARN